MREYKLIDQILSEVDLAIRTLIPSENRASTRSYPGQNLQESSLTLAQKKHIAALMRVNHSGEVCAQALYQGQALTAQLEAIKEQMAKSAQEENDHLAWCEQRLRELDSQPSLFNPVWYLGSLMIGAIAGLAGDRFSLGFVAETECQVSAHLQKHLNNIPVQDKKTKVILEQMQADESHHAEVAKQAGAIELPTIIKQLMHGISKLMTNTSYHF